MSTRTPEDFCDMSSHDWPAELRNLQDAAAQAASSYRVIADLASSLDAGDHKGRAEMRDIETAAYSAWMLLERRGLKLLAGLAPLPEARHCATCGQDLTGEPPHTIWPYQQGAAYQCTDCHDVDALAAEQREAERRQQRNAEAIADGTWPPYASEY